jgi:hypothetical protein
MNANLDEAPQKAALVSKARTDCSYDYDGDGIPDYFEDTNGNGAYDAGDLTDWRTYNSANALNGNQRFQVFTPLK